MTTKRRTAKATFAAEELKTMQDAAQEIWNEIGYDCLQAIAFEKRVHVDRVTMSRAHVIEVVLDAGRFEERLHRYGVADDFLTRVANADYDTLIAAVKPAFPYSRYGM